ncbi:unnamed protein product [Cuscuta epithymum]|uniref:Uncharacterized protein n=1 Tax=Cuscuta epithymum TaxID=186058 RepID=A0AAV0C1N4_9ASTE|nr:unnamed protein product [Cuscuta epithymum]
MAKIFSSVGYTVALIVAVWLVNLPSSDAGCRAVILTETNSSIVCIWSSESSTLVPDNSCNTECKNRGMDAGCTNSLQYPEGCGCSKCD